MAKKLQMTVIDWKYKEKSSSCRSQIPSTMSEIARGRVDGVLFASGKVQVTLHSK